MIPLLNRLGKIDVYRTLESTPPTPPTPGGATAQRLTLLTSGGGWTTIWPRALAAYASREQIYKIHQFSDHAPVTVEYYVSP